MRSPEVILENLGNKAKNKSYRFERLYRNLYNPEFFLLAYQKIAASQGSMTAGTDGNTLDGMSMVRIERIIQSLKDHSYQPQPVRRMYIAKKNSSKKRPLGIPSTDDKLVQEIVRVILESIYEPTFSDNSHGFRPNRSCHTCLGQIQLTFTGVKWFVEGDIKGCFDNIDHHILISILRRRIADESFIELLWKFLRAGYLENWTYNATYSGAPQGSLFVTYIRAILLRDTGATISPFNAFLLLQGIETLPLRLDRHAENTKKVIEYLKNHPQVEKVNHPSLPDHPDHELYEKYFPNGGGSIFTFEIKGGREAAWKFIDSLKIFSLLANVADVKSLVIHPATTTHAQLSDAELEAAGITQSTIRLSIGTEHIDDIIEDLESAFEAVNQ